jgi:hypothetical protein
MAASSSLYFSVVLGCLYGSITLVYYKGDEYWCSEEEDEVLRGSGVEIK